jgi:hypothetical protein
MQHAHRPFATAALTIAGAALAAAGIAATTASQTQHHNVQLVDTAQYVYDLGQSEISTGTALYNQGEFAAGLQNILIGENNVAIDSPQDALLEQIETPTQPSEFVVTNPDNIAAPTNAAQLAEYLQQVTQIGENLLNQGSSELASGATNLGLADLTRGADDLSVILPQDALYGPTWINIATTGDPVGIPSNIYGLIDPASYGDDSLGYLTNAVETEVIGPINTFAEVAGIDLGPVGGLLSAADAVQTLNEFTGHWDGFIAGNEVDSLHVGVETSELLFTAAGAMTGPDLPPLSLGFDAIATGLGGIDTFLTNAFGY